MARAPIDAAPRFAANHYAARRALGLTQTQVAARMSARGFKWHQATVYKIENGSRQVHIGEAAAVAAVLGVPLDRMVSETPARIARIAKDNLRSTVIV